MTIRILIVDDQALFREGVRTLLSVWRDLEVVGEASHGEEAIKMTASLAPDVILMDLHMPVMGGAAATRRIVASHPDSRVIVLTTFDDDEHIFEALRAGAAGYLLKDVPSAKLVEAIRATVHGESFLQPSVAARVIAEFTRVSGGQPAVTGHPSIIEPLSEREIEVLSLLSTGSSNREIARELFITEGTVKNHVTSILGKLDVRDRTQAALKARELGLI